MSISSRILFSTTLFFVGLLASFSAAANQDSESSQPLASTLVKPEPIQHLTNQGLEVVRSFPVGKSLVGWVVRFDDKDMLVYTTADGEYLINGLVLDAQGVDLTAEHQKTWLPQPQWEVLADADYLTEPSLKKNSDNERTTASRIYVFFDPNCSFSQLAWLALQPYREAGVQVNWLPVAYLSSDSRRRAAALLDAEDFEALLAKNMLNQGETLEALDGDLQDHHRKQLQANLQLMQSFGINGTPGWIWQDEEGELQTHSGMPRLPRLSDITGLPQQEHSETELMRFR